jgi:hypothetical protein
MTVGIKLTTGDAEATVRTVPLISKDEMNLVEFPFGPVTQCSAQTYEVEHQTFDRQLKRKVTRCMLITGSAAFGLPRPIDDQVLVGMKALPHEAQYASRRVAFSRYQLCRTLGWAPDGRAYKRLEESFDRIAATTLKFKDAWWDKGEKSWKSKTFHLIEEVDLCSRDELERHRAGGGAAGQRLCSFVWSEVVWKSFQDGFIKTLDMNMFRRVARGRRREVPLRLFRILDKRFHYGNVSSFELERLCVGTLGLNRDYSPSQMLRILERAVQWLVRCDYLTGMRYVTATPGRPAKVVFQKQLRASAAPRSRQGKLFVDAEDASACGATTADREHQAWLAEQQECELLRMERQALDAGFGSLLERRIVEEDRLMGTPLLGAGRIRQAYVRRFAEHAPASAA